MANEPYRIWAEDTKAMVEPKEISPWTSKAKELSMTEMKPWKKKKLRKSGDGQGLRPADSGGVEETP